PGLKDFIITDSFMKDGVFHLHMEVERKPHHCPSCNTLTNQIHDYRLQKIQHTNIFSRESILFYRNRRFVCGCCKKLFDETNELVGRYQRQSKGCTESIALELTHGKSFKDVADRFHTPTSTVIRRFDTINADMLNEPKPLPSVIAIGEYKVDAA